MRRTWRQDGVAGLINAVASVPDGLASAALAGVNPIHGLYPSIAAPIIGGALQSAQLQRGLDLLGDKGRDIDVIPGAPTCGKAGA